MFRTLATQVPRRAIVATRSLHASPAAFKSMTEKVKETAQDVNIKVGQTLASGLEKGEQATEAAKETIGTKSEETKQQAEKVSTEATQKARQASAGAQEAKEDTKADFKKNVK